MGDFFFSHSENQALIEKKIMESKDAKSGYVYITFLFTYPISFDSISILLFIQQKKAGLSCFAFGVIIKV